MRISQPTEPVAQVLRPADGGLIYAVIVLAVIVVLLAIWIYWLKIRLRRHPTKPATFSPWLLVSPEEAQAGAEKGYRDYGLLERGDWRPRLWDDARGVPRPTRQPLLVQRLDITDDFYYLVPVGSSDEEVEAVVRVDGITGEYLEATATPPPRERDRADRSWGSMVAEWRTEKDTRQRIARGAAERTDSVSDAAGVRVHPPFVWKPCRESRSPFYPFRLVATRTRRYYVRIDGKEFGSLTDLGPASAGTPAGPSP